MANGDIPFLQEESSEFSELRLPADAATFRAALGAGTGSVTSVALTMPTGFSVGGSPITTSGTLAVTTALSGIIKGTGSGLTTAVSGTDYLPITGGTSVTTLGTISAGTWQGTPIATTYAGLPTGGTSGQILKKSSATNYDTAWVDPSTEALTSVGLTMPTGFTVTGSPLTSNGTLAVTTALSGIITANGSAFSAITPGTGVTSALAQNVTGSGGIVLGTSPTIVTPTIAAISNLTTNGFVKTSAGTGTLVIDTNTYITGNQTITLSGDVTGSGATAISTTVGKINGTSLAGLATGILKNTTGTGVPSIAVSGTDYLPITGGTSITTLGTITTGTWNGTVIGSSYGGAGSVSGALKANGSGVVSQAASTDLSNSSNIPLLNANNAFTGNNTVTSSSGVPLTLVNTGSAALETYSDNQPFVANYTGLGSFTGGTTVTAWWASTSASPGSYSEVFDVMISRGAGAISDVYLYCRSGVNNLWLTPGGGSPSAGYMLSQSLFVIPSSVTLFLESGNLNSDSAAINIQTASFNLTGKTTKYNNISTAGWGSPAIYGYGRSSAQSAAVASVASYTVGGSDGTFLVSANILVTASVTNSFTCTCTYTDEAGNSRTLTLTFSNIGGTLLNTITNVTGTGAYEGVPLHIRAKASTSITIATTGTFTSVTYNVEGAITQIA